MNLLNRCLPACLCILLLTGCGTKTTTTLSVRAATEGVMYAQSLLTQRSEASRPSAVMGIFSSIYLSQGGFFRVSSALSGVIAEMKLVKPLSPDDLDEAFLLLQEFGSVLQVNIPDLLNRSPDRPKALNEYLTGLANITKRSQLKVAEIQAGINARELDRRAAEKALSDINRQISNATRVQDYATTGLLQRDRSEATATLNKTQSDVSRLRDVLNIYNSLLALSARRSLAIESNREILLAGLKVVDVPGIESLNILQNQSSFRRGASNLLGS
ncbi:MAG: hypothetical protein JWM56_818 [Candidatus Peribacteria bacterium]|nr:hypothetical protein [Candidatus Peribacteria bacterium]